MRLERFRSIIHNTGELKKLIEENPDLPLLIFAGDEANSGDYAWMCCTEVSCEKTEVLDCKGPKDGRLYTDREELEDDVGEELFDEVGDIPDEEFEKLLKERMKPYEEYWTDVIVLWVTGKGGWA